VGAILVPVAMVAAMSLRESFGSSLDWTEDADGSRSDGLDGHGKGGHGTGGQGNGAHGSHGSDKDAPSRA
jgi:hypothetical protein